MTNKNLKRFVFNFKNKVFNLNLGILSAIIIGLSTMSDTVSAQQNTTCSTPEYRQFDFWIGEWEVKDAQGNIAGTNHIFPILNGCALSENWSNPGGFKGVSYNFYDKNTHQWHQTWVDISGGALYLNGGLIDGKMVLSGVHVDQDAEKVIHRIVWTPLEDGRVSQHWQSSSDDSKTWSDVFLGFYKKVKQSK